MTTVQPAAVPTDRIYPLWSDTYIGRLVSRRCGAVILFTTYFRFLSRPATLKTL
jgi:hypothetical protein